MKYLLIILFVLFIQTASAMRINEVELNPSGDDTGNEWVELYNRGEIMLDNYKLVNNDRDEIKLSGNFDDYYVYTFTKQWLDNSDEKIFLYNGEKLIDETDLLEDTENNENTWNYCSEWKFGGSTKSEKNRCENDDKSEEPLIEIIINDEKNETEKNEPQVLEPINLNPKTIKTENNKESSNKNNYALWGLGFFCVLLVFLFVLKKRKERFNKNEFKK